MRQIRPYRPDPMTRVLRAALADTETTTLLPVITPDGPSAVRLGAPTVLVNDWRPTPAEPVMPPTPAARPPIWLDLADPWERLSRCRTIMRAPASPAPDLADQPWFREFDTSANDRSLRAFQEKFATRDRADVVLNADASPRTLVMTLAGDDQFGPRRPR